MGGRRNRRPHFAFVLFVVLGASLVLRWPRMAWFHIPAVLWGALLEFSGWICPLTPLEIGFAASAGEQDIREISFAHYVLRVLYPEGLTRRDQLMLGSIAIALTSRFMLSSSSAIAADIKSLFDLQ